MGVTKQEDVQAFFGFVHKQNNTLANLLTDYMNYHGGLDWGQMGLVAETAIKLRGAAGHADAAGLGRGDVMGSDGQLRRAFLEPFAPALADGYFADGPHEALTGTAVFPTSANQYESHDLPAPFNQRLKNQTRPGLEIFAARGRQLFVSPYGYQYFDATQSCAWRLASCRAFAKSILKYPYFSVDAPVVVVQDQYDSGNFAHFLFDAVPRIIYFIKTFPQAAKTALFVLGGKKNAFHTFILGNITEKYGIAYQHFHFPTDRRIFNLGGPVYFFSDQRKTITHPLHMCAPETMGLVRNLLNRFQIDTDMPERIYISRDDAGMRRIGNEASLVVELRKFGYCKIVHSRLSVRDQISILASAKHIVAPHGMGLTNMVFNTRAGSLLELFNPAAGNDCFAFLAHALAMDYEFLIGTPDDRSRLLDYNIDVGEVMAFVSARHRPIFSS